MSVPMRWLRPAIGWLVKGHGLAHAVLPLRGRLDPGLFECDLMPFILYGVAVMGFSMAGVGLLGVAPFAAAVRPLLVIASAYSLVSISLMGPGDLWWGVTFDVMLLLTGLTGAYHYLPVVQNRSTLPRLMTVSIATAFLLYVASAMVAVAIASDLGITAQRVRHGIAWRCERSEPGTGGAARGYGERAT